jgi:hypothetical protein
MVHNIFSLKSLGLLGENISRTKQLSKSSMKRTQGIPITFGHENWEWSFYMFFGVRLSVSVII